MMDKLGSVIGAAVVVGATKNLMDATKPKKCKKKKNMFRI